jgi:hypothetical protein
VHHPSKDSWQLSIYFCEAVQAGSDCNLNAGSDAAADLLPNPGHPVPLWIPWFRLHPLLRGPEPEPNYNPGTDDSTTNNPTSDNPTTNNPTSDDTTTDNATTNDANNSCATTR